MTAYGLSKYGEDFKNRRLSVSGSTRFATSDHNSINPQASINLLDLVCRIPMDTKFVVSYVVSTFAHHVILTGNDSIDAVQAKWSAQQISLVNR